MTKHRNVTTTVLGFKSAALALIAAGVLTVTQTAHAVDVEGGAAGSDDLDTISGGNADQLLVLRPYSDARSIVLKHGTGNIECQGAVDLTLAEDDDYAVLIKAGTKWSVVASKTKAAIVPATATNAATADLATNATLAAQATKVANSSRFRSNPTVATGIQQTIAHGLAGTPSLATFMVTAGHDGAGAAGDKYPTAIDFTAPPDATNVYITATEGCTFRVRAEL